MVDISRFKKPGSYVRYFNMTKKKDVYLYLEEAEVPLVYPYTFAHLAPNTKQSDATNLKELNPSESHIFQCLVGFAPGARFYIWHKYDKKILSWDENITDISEDDTRWLDHTMSSITDPKFEMWIDHDRYPAFQPKNMFLRQYIYPKLIVFAAKFNFKVVTDENELDKLEKRIIRSTPILLGRGGLLST